MPKFNVGDMVIRVKGSFGNTILNGIYIVSQADEGYLKIKDDPDSDFNYDANSFELINTEKAIELKLKEFEAIREDLEKFKKKLQEENNFQIGDKFKRDITGEVFILASVGFNHQTNNNLVALVSLKDGNRWKDAVECYVSDFKITKQDFKKVSDSAHFVKVPN